MPRYSRILVAGSLAATLGFAAAPAVHAQDAGTPPAMGAGGSSSILDSLNTANEALNGPVKVKRNAEGLTVTYTNETDKPQKCSGLVLPYDQVVAKGLDKPDGPSGLNLLGTLFDIVNQGNSAVLFYEKDADGVKQPASLSGADAKGKASKGTMGATTSGLLPATEPGANRTWTATSPDKDAVAVILCDGFFGTNLTTYKGIEDSIFFQQVGDQLGSAGSVATGSSDNPTVAGSVTTSIPALISIIEFFNRVVETFQNFFTGIFGNQLPGSSSRAGEQPEGATAPAGTN
ncbi:hypothetical protein D3M95_11085 [Corynebacterium falsenii]|uniref:Secreted protein n=1 Tax=Corynebacterium falsenii TaxID=108486 RepID=A0A418Q4I4_9CORY|nr:hypothetical protein [Corynebacterium falsenii]RIX33140.1 hypothetical protein D3M95_11085 [Corynebacterium falsenii]